MKQITVFGPRKASALARSAIAALAPIAAQLGLTVAHSATKAKNGHAVDMGFTFAVSEPVAKEATNAAPERPRLVSPVKIYPYQINGKMVDGNGKDKGTKAFMRAIATDFSAANLKAHGKCDGIATKLGRGFEHNGEVYTLVGFAPSRRDVPFIVQSPVYPDREVKKGGTLWLVSPDFVRKNAVHKRGPRGK